MTPLSYSRFPVDLNQYRITSAYELQILAWTATLPNGLRQSNNQLAEILHTDRRTIINAINRLRGKKLVENTGTKYSRVLVASSEIVSLLNSDDVSPLNSERVSQNSERVSQNSEKPDTHKYKRINNTTTTFSFHLRGNGDLWHLSEVKLNSYLEAYKGVDVERELRKAAQWLIDNPQKRKTARGMPRFLNGWLTRAKSTSSQEYTTRDCTEEEAEELMKEVTA